MIRLITVSLLLLLFVSLELHCSRPPDIREGRKNIRTETIRRIRSFKRPERKKYTANFVRQSRFKTRKKENNEPPTTTSRTTTTTAAFRPRLASRHRFRLNTAPGRERGGEEEEVISPTRSYQAQAERTEEDEEEDILPGLRSGLITVTHSVFTITRADYEETLTSLAELVNVSRLMRTTLGMSGILFAHSERNQPVQGITEVTIEEILPTKTISPAGRSLLTAYNVVTHTSTITDTDSQADQGEDQASNILQGLNLFQGLIPNLRYPAAPHPPLPPLPPLPTTTFTTVTVTEISTVTSDITTQLTVTLFGRPITTEYIRETRVVFTDIHVSRAPVIISG